jgi:hypothetical protein
MRGITYTLLPYHISPTPGVGGASTMPHNSVNHSGMDSAGGCKVYALTQVCTLNSVILLRY